MDAQALTPVLDEVLSFMDSALQTHEQDQAAIADLNNKVAQHERIVLEKVAALKLSSLDLDRVKTTINEMATMGIMTQMEAVKVASRIQAEPNSVCDFMLKMADALVKPGEGQEFLDTPDTKLDDQDGWFRDRR